MRVNELTEKPNQKYRVVRDDHGYACAIAGGDQWFLHLNPGTEFNEKNAGQIVDELNQRQDFIDHIRWTQNLWRHGIEIMRKNNLVIASDTPMEKLAFTFYSDLCEIDSRALHLFGEGPGDENYKDRGAIQAREIVPYPRPYEEAIKQAAEANGKKKVLTGLLYAMNDPQLTICDTGYREHSYWTGYIRNLLSALDADKAKEKAGE